MDLKFFSKTLEDFNIIFSKTLTSEILEQLLFFSIFLIIIYFLFVLFLNFLFRLVGGFNQKFPQLYLERIKTISKIIKTIFGYFLIFIFIIFILTRFKINLTPILTGAGFLGATLVLIFQNSLRDILTGWILVFEDIFREGDFVVINDGFKGKVIDFKSRFLVLRGLQGEVILIPYSQINIIKNFTRYRLITKIILKLKKSWELLEKIENLMMSLNFEPEKRVSFLYLDKNFKLSGDQIEIAFYFKMPYQLKDEVLYQIKSKIVEELRNDIIEIRDES